MLHISKFIISGTTHKKYGMNFGFLVTSEQNVNGRPEGKIDDLPLKEKIIIFIIFSQNFQILRCYLLLNEDANLFGVFEKNYE